MAKFDFELGDHRLVARYSVGSCSRVEGDKRIEAHRAPKLLRGCVGRSDRSALPDRRSSPDGASASKSLFRWSARLGLAFTWA
jgi:hypothetical protein